VNTKVAAQLEDQTSGHYAHCLFYNVFIRFHVHHGIFTIAYYVQINKSIYLFQKLSTVKIIFSNYVLRLKLGYTTFQSDYFDADLFTATLSDADPSHSRSISALFSAVKIFILAAFVMSI